MYIGLFLLIVFNLASLVVFLVALWRASRLVAFDAFQLSTMGIYVILLTSKTDSLFTVKAKYARHLSASRWMSRLAIGASRLLRAFRLISYASWLILSGSE